MFSVPSSCREERSERSRRVLVSYGSVTGREYQGPISLEHLRIAPRRLMGSSTSVFNPSPRLVSPLISVATSATVFQVNVCDSPSFSSPFYFLFVPRSSLYLCFPCLKRTATLSSTNLTLLVRSSGSSLLTPEGLRKRSKSLTLKLHSD